MLKITKENYFYNIFIFIALFTCPVIVLAPVGSWVPVILSAVLISLYSRVIFLKFSINNIHITIITAFLWIAFSIIFIGKNLQVLEKFFHLSFLILSGFIVSLALLNNPNFKKIVIIFSTSFIFSTLLIIIDIKTNLGLKLWLSKNFDFSNFENIYKFKNWISFNNFKTQYYDLIRSYNHNTYNRGVIGLTILSWPLFALCFLYNYKVSAYIILVFSCMLTISTLNFSVILCHIVSLSFGAIYFMKQDIFKKYFLWFFGLYFITCPFILGQLDYKKFSKYETDLLQKKNNLFSDYCQKTSGASMYYKMNKLVLVLSCNEDNEKKKKYSRNDFLHQSENDVEKIKLFLKFKIYNTASNKLHRLIIWSFSKEKIIEKPFLGHGFYSSRYIASEMKKTKNKTNYQLIPLHPHNSILQIWLELGAVGVIIFFIFIKKLLNKIYRYDEKNHYIATITIISFFQIFTIGQISFGFWQPWWIGLILINYILYKFIFSYFKFNEPQ
ncbi:MAG: hypothetical protein CML36_02045 [Rhodobacteraceae bacterium]|nr:hypothetical protein [Paracoccaceae bacterium]OUU62501.1 MAG: hypothetical protein CBC22_04235 [Alphaproteobacteria bacterium TMED62]|tara:strand:+ start:2743 stop:4236 length:1494 start_codon:yes stop_codon:yes gene_type:complete